MFCVSVVYGSSPALIDACKTPARSDLPETRTAQTGSLVHLHTGECVCACVRACVCVCVFTCSAFYRALIYSFSAVYDWYMCVCVCVCVCVCSHPQPPVGLRSIALVLYMTDICVCVCVCSQVLCLALLWVLKSTVAAIIFPVMVSQNTLSRFNLMCTTYKTGLYFILFSIKRPLVWIRLWLAISMSFCYEIFTIFYDVNIKTLYLY